MDCDKRANFNVGEIVKTRLMQSEAHKLVNKLKQAQEHMTTLGEELPFYLLKDFSNSIQVMVNYIDMRSELIEEKGGTK